MKKLSDVNIKVGAKVRLYDNRDINYKELLPFTEDGLEILAITIEEGYTTLYLEQGYSLSFLSDQEEAND
jgi:hypothetical protein